MDRRPQKAKAFYAAIAIRTLIGVALNFTALDPIKALYGSAVVNGVLAAPLMAVLMLVAANPRVMGSLTTSRPIRIVDWLASLVMALCTVGFAGLCARSGHWAPRSKTDGRAGSRHRDFLLAFVCSRTDGSP